MLTQDDVAWIRSNRDEITANRTELIEIIRTIETGRDPYTNEPITDEVAESADVVWKEIKALRDGDLQIIGGIALEDGDVTMTLPPDIAIDGITSVRRGDVDYRLIAYDERGLGGKNRYECVVRRVT